MVTSDLDKTSSTGIEKMKVKWVKENGEMEPVSNSLASSLGFLLQSNREMGGNWWKKWEILQRLYADGNDPMEIKLGSGRQGGLMGSFS